MKYVDTQEIEISRINQLESNYVEWLLAFVFCVTSCGALFFVFDQEHAHSAAPTF